MLKALIFDFDGLIADTETPDYQAMNEFYQEWGYTLPMESFGLSVGSLFTPAFDPVQNLQHLSGRSLDPETFWSKVKGRRDALLQHLQPLPGVEKLIRDASSYGLKLAVASSSSHEWVDAHLKNLNLYNYFDVIKCAEDVRQVKPSPDLFLAALGAFQLQPAEAVIFEDSLNGAIAAGRAGIPVVVVPNQVTRHMKFDGAALVLPSLADTSVSQLLAKF